MTAPVNLSVLVAGARAWREVYPLPPDLRLDVGPWCPLDDTVLQDSDGPTPDDRTWKCQTCWAVWDYQGRSGRWLPLPGADVAAPARRLDRQLTWFGVVSMGTALALTAGVQVGPFADEVPEQALYWASVGLLAVAGVLVLVGWLAGVIDRWPYRHNRVRRIDPGELAVRAPRLAALLEVADAPALPAGAPQALASGEEPTGVAR